jgi:hypothetical protein
MTRTAATAFSRSLDLPPAARLGLLCVLGGLAVGVALSLAWHFALADLAAPPPLTYDLVIPPGTADMVSRGAAPPSIPTSLTFSPDDTLHIVNQDSAPHQVGQIVVQPGQEARFPLSFYAPAGQTSRLLCTFHPGSVLELSVKPPRSAGSVLLPALVIGLPLGLAAFAVVGVTSRLDSSSDGGEIEASARV